MTNPVDHTRITLLNDRPPVVGSCVIYWMQKDQRPGDNWALLRAAELANEHEVPLVVAFFVSDKMRNAYVRQFNFMLRGLAETAAELRVRGVGFVMRHGSPVRGITELAVEVSAIAVVTDQSYLQLGQSRRRVAATALSVSLEAVDAAMIVPPHELADKQLWAAYVARPKLRDHLERYLTDYPELELAQTWHGQLDGLDDQDPDEIMAGLKLDARVRPVNLLPGPVAARARLDKFVTDVARYETSRNDPNADATSRLSAYLRFGQLSSQRVVWELRHSPAYERDKAAIDAYIDEIVTWRELSTNFCRYNGSYNSYAGIPEWAKRSLEAHASDQREFVYTTAEFETAATHDDLWNAAQMEMVKTGRMHGYMRMYWAKKMLEWTASPADAIEAAVYLNDKYELDGREPGGYTGILWAIGGLHDRPWFERDIYGQIRYMNYNGAKKKFDVTAYIERIRNLS